MAVPVLESRAENAFSSLSTWTVDKPSGVAAGDLLLAILTSGTGPVTWTPPAGWTAGPSATSSPYVYAWWKIAGGSEPATYDFTTGSSRSGKSVVYRISGAHQSSPLDASTGATNSGANPLTLPSVTPTAADCLYIATLVLNSSGIRTWSTTSPMSSAYTPSVNGYQYTGYTENRGAASATGAYDFTCSSTTPTRVGMGIMVAPLDLDQTVSPSGIASAEAVATPTLTYDQTVSPSGIASEEAFGTPTVAGYQTVSPSGIASEEAFGTPTVLIGQVISPAGIATAEDFGTPTVTQGVGSPPVGGPAEGAGVGGLGDPIVPAVGLVPSRRAQPAFFRIKLTSLHYPSAPSLGLPARYAKTLARIEDYQDASVTIPINDSREASVTISMNDPACIALRPPVGGPYKTLLHVIYVTPSSSYLVFWGIVTKPVWDPNGETVQIPAVDMSLRLQNHQIRLGDRILNGSDDAGAPNPLNTTGTKRSTGRIPLDYRGLRWLRDCGINTDGQTARGVPDLGIKNGTNTNSALPDDTPYRIEGRRGDTVWDVWRTAVGYQIMPDFELEPYDSEPGYYALLNTADRLGDTDASRIVFHDGFGIDNAHIRYEPGGKVITHAHVLSSGDKTRVTVADVDSSAEIGVYTAWDSTQYPANSTEALHDRGEQTIAAYGSPPDYYTVIPNLDCGLFYLDHFVPGDAHTAAVRRGQLQGEFQGDITKVTLAQADGSGNVHSELETAVLVDTTVGDEGNT